MRIGLSHCHPDECANHGTITDRNPTRNHHCNRRDTIIHTGRDGDRAAPDHRGTGLRHRSPDHPDAGATRPLTGYVRGRTE
jgi:hypothetical protein